jgi:bifunctional UDP-N-acetylglucosamine pyrophosphorylase/glucosamine-1-phosphate N-acetyltransferase
VAGVTRTLIVPAAGRGTRLRSTTPKLLHPVAGRPMIEHVLDRYHRVVDRIIVVVSPAIADAVARGSIGYDVEWLVQPEPTGMLDAILVPHRTIRRLSPRYVWVTWCDQVAVTASTVSELARRTGADAAAAVVFPTVRQQPPYVHWVRDPGGRVVGVRQRREGDRMPQVGESDVGLFAVRADTYLDELPVYRDAAPTGEGTAERNFLPFVPWMASRSRVETFPGRDPIEARGINTPADLAAVEAFLRSPRGGA